MKITIKGRIPSKKNSKKIIWRNKRPLIISSAQYRKWEDEQMWILPRIKKPLKIKKIKMKFYVPDKRKGDLDNKATSVLDLLIKRRIIKDDNWFEIPEIYLIFKGIDKSNPRCEITLYER